jgi:hypothetical protein
MTEQTVPGLKRKRAAIAGQIVDLRRQIDRLLSDLFHVDQVLKLYGEEPGDIPTKGRMPKRGTYFGRNEITRRCFDVLREKGTISADDVAVQAMRDKGFDPEADRKQRTDFGKRILTSLHDLRRKGHVEKIGLNRNVRWRLAGAD